MLIRSKYPRKILLNCKKWITANAFTRTPAMYMATAEQIVWLLIQKFWGLSCRQIALKQVRLEATCKDKLILLLNRGLSAIVQNLVCKITLTRTRTWLSQRIIGYVKISRVYCQLGCLIRDLGEDQSPTLYIQADNWAEHLQYACFWLKLPCSCSYEVLETIF